MALFTSEGCTVHQDNPARCQKSILPNIAVTVKGETPLIDKLAPFLTAAQLYYPQAFEKKKESGAFWF